MAKLNQIAGSGGGGGGCFRAGTQIQIEGGKTVSIENLTVGQEVLSYDEQGKIFVSKVLEVHYHEAEALIRVEFWNGSIDITSNHWVLNQYGAFVEIGTLTIHDALVDGMGHLRPIKGAKVLGVEPVWNLTVDPNHTFIANGIRVHNGGYRERFPVAGSGGGGGGGGKGGGGSQHVPVESPDSLHSKQFARIIDLVSEGEIEGLYTAPGDTDPNKELKSVYLDNTPVMDSDGSMNFSGITFYSRPGTQNQEYIPGFNVVEAEASVNTEVKYGIPVVRSISNVNTNAVRITLGFPSLTFQNQTTGDMTGSTVDIKIEVNTNGGGYVEKVTDTISGKTTSLYQRSYRIELASPGPWDIRVTRLTEDSLQSNHRNESWWASYTELIDSKLSYPNSALFAASIDSSQFKSVPSRGYLIKGIKVKIPSNYNPLTRVYTGVWDGTFTVAWTDNPAWCFYDMITEPRYGLGNFIAADQVDKWSLYTIAQYCDELVSDGYGGTEPRFTCNLYLQTREEAYKVINSMASIFRGLVYWAGGAIVPIQDAPKDPAGLFTPANVIDGQFNYEGTSAKARHTVVLVSWNDPEDRYKQKVEYVEDADGIERFGVVQSDLVAVGCTSRGQAHRIGRWLLYTERLESEVVTFKTGLEGLRVNPGEIIKTSDPVRASSRRGGRILTATSFSITLDSSITIMEGQTYTLWVVLPDGTVESRTVANGIGTYNVFNVVSAYSDTPTSQAIWVMGSTSLVPETWRIISISEADQVNATITATSYREDKYYAVENDLVLEPLPTSLANAASLPVTNMDVTEALYLVGLGVVGVKGTISWTSSSTSHRYIVRYYKTKENIVEVETQMASIDVGPLSEGLHTFEVISINTLGKKSTVVSINKEIFGKLIPPDDVDNFNLAVVNGGAYLTWNPSTDLDVLVGGNLRVRYTPETVTPTWNNSIDIGGLLSGISTSQVLPLLSGTYLAKWIDSTGNQSVNATYITTDLNNFSNQNFILTITEDPAFSGTKTNMIVDLAVGGLKIAGGTTIDGILTNIDSWGYIDAHGGIAPTASYAFSAAYTDLAAVYTSRVSSRILVELYDAGDLIDSRTQNIDTWTSVDGSVIDDVHAVLMIRTTSDDPSGSPTWSAWQPFHVGDWTARAFQFRLDVTNESPTHNMVIKELSVTIDMPDRVSTGDDVVSGASTYSVTFSPPFKVVPNIAITAQNMATGDYYTISNKAVGGFDIVFKNSAGTDVSRTFDWQARGY